MSELWSKMLTITQISSALKEITECGTRINIPRNIPQSPGAFALILPVGLFFVSGLSLQFNFSAGNQPSRSEVMVNQHFFTQSVAYSSRDSATVGVPGAVSNFITRMAELIPKVKFLMYKISLSGIIIYLPLDG